VESEFIAQHKAKHLLAHVLVAAGARRWPQATRGDSGETSTGFFADFAMPDVPGEAHLAELSESMARLLRDFRTFRGLRVTPDAARTLLIEHPWKQHVVEALEEIGASVGLYELDGVVDLCDCAIKQPEELRALHPEKFLLTSAAMVPWAFRGRTTWFVRIRGELFPTPPPCLCCSA